MNHINTIFWDWNGTLLNDVDECLQIINQSLKTRSLKKLDIEEYLEKFEFPVKNYYANIGFDFKVESFEEAGREFIEAYSKKMFSFPLHDGAKETLHQVKLLGINQYILSALNHDALKKCIKSFALEEFFHQVRGLDDSYAHSKIELGIDLLKESECSPQTVLMVGDTVHDFEVASAMGVDCVLIAAGHNSKKRLEQCGVPVFDSILEFNEALMLAWSNQA